jgi:O-antigen/teichoic acid export membrane protein
LTPSSTTATPRPARQWLRLVASPLGASVATSAAAMIASALLYRVLPGPVAGAFALLTALIQTILILGGMGQYTLTLRLYSRAAPGAHRWRADLGLQTLFTLLPSALLTLIITALYALSPGEAAFLLGASMMWGAVSSLGSMLSSQRRYTLGLALPRAPNALMLLPAALIAVAPALATLPTVLLAQLLAAALALGLGWAAMARLRAPGDRLISLRQRVYGLVFLATQSASLVPDSLLLAAAGYLVAVEQLALFGAVALLFRPVSLLQNVLAQVLTTELARSERPRMARFIALTALVSGVLVAGGVLLGPVAVEVIYGGRYAPSLTLIAFLSLMSGLMILEILPRSYLIGRAGRRLLAWFSGAQLAIAGGGLLAGIALISQFGIEGAAAGGALIYLARSVVSYGAFAGLRLREGRRSSAA